MRKNCRLIIIPNLKGHIQKATKEGFILKKYNEYYSDLRDLSGKDPKTKKMAERCFNNNVVVDGLFSMLQRSSDWLVVGDESRHKSYDQQCLIGFLDIRMPEERLPKKYLLRNAKIFMVNSWSNKTLQFHLMNY